MRCRALGLELGDAERRENAGDITRYITSS
jgi:hypothetical protein